MTDSRHRFAIPAAAEVPALVQGLRKLGHVARAYYRPVHCGMSGLPARHSFQPGAPHRHSTSLISPYEYRSSGYPSAADVRSLAPSPNSLTGKPSLTFSVGPFIVELFTAGFLARSPRWSPRFGLSPGSKLPTPAALKELARNTQAHSPADGIWGKTSPHPLCPRTALLRRARFFRLAQIPDEKHQQQGDDHRIERRDYSGGVASPHTTGACNNQDYSDEPPLNWTSTSRCDPARRAAVTGESKSPNP